MDQRNIKRGALAPLLFSVAPKESNIYYLCAMLDRGIQWWYDKNRRQCSVNLNKEVISCKQGLVPTHLYLITYEP